MQQQGHQTIPLDQLQGTNTHLHTETALAIQLTEAATQLLNTEADAAAAYTQAETHVPNPDHLLVETHAEHHNHELVTHLSEAAAQTFHDDAAQALPLVALPPTPTVPITAISIGNADIIEDIDHTELEATTPYIPTTEAESNLAIYTQEFGTPDSRSDESDVHIPNLSNPSPIRFANYRTVTQYTRPTNWPIPPGQEHLYHVDEGPDHGPEARGSNDPHQRTHHLAHFEGTQNGDPAPQRNHLYGKQFRQELKKTLNQTKQTTQKILHGKEVSNKNQIQMNTHFT